MEPYTSIELHVDSYQNAHYTLKETNFNFHQNNNNSFW